MRVFVFLVVLCLVQSVVGYGSGISSTVFSVANYQAENGGFTTNIMEGEQGNLEDTAHALFLASLFGVKDKIDADQTLSFLRSVHNPDKGYTNQPGQTSDLESVHNALLSYKYLNTIPYDGSGLVEFVNSLYDANSKLFRNAPGSHPDYKATARALQIYDLLEVKSEEVITRRHDLLEKLKTAVKTKDEQQSFFSSITSDNYFAIVIADLVGFEFEEPQTWTAYFQSRQASNGPHNGGFFADEYFTDATPSDAEYALQALYLLSGRQGVSHGLVNLQTLAGFLNSLPPGLSNAGHSYAALARTVAFEEFFKVSATYVVKGDARFRVTGDRIIQGSVFRPNVFFRTTYGQSNAGASVSATISHASKTENIAFAYNPSTNLYESQDYFDSSDLFGEVSLSYKVKFETYGFENLEITFVETKSIGYDISVSAKATDASGSEVAIADEVGLGTSFSFNIELGTVSVPKPALVSGDFKIALNVLDSSNVVVHSDNIDAASHRGSLSFDFTLSDAKIPAGPLTFKFQVSNADGVHTTEVINYVLRVAMVAAEIDWDEEQILNFGQKVTVSMQPGTLADNKVSFYGKGTRRFFLDIHSQKSHIRLASFPGHARGEEYIFDLSIPARFDFLGKGVVSFRYTDAYGNDVVLQNYDSAEGALKKEDLVYTVEATLDITDLTGAPEPGDLKYGDEINFSFKVQDSFSENFLQKGLGDTNVFLALRHTGTDGKTYTSTKVRASPSTDETGLPVLFTVNWEVDANADKGEGVLVLYALDADATEYPIKDGEAFSVGVSVTGNLRIEPSTYSHIFDDVDTTFFVSFDLKNDESRSLNGAEFVAKITGADSSVIGVVPVATGAEGYQVSWTLDTNAAKSGTYTVDIFKKAEADRASSKLFSLPVQHHGRVVSPLPFRSEFFALLGLFVVYTVVTVQKLKTEKKHK